MSVAAPAKKMRKAATAVVREDVAAVPAPAAATSDPTVTAGEAEGVVAPLARVKAWLETARPGDQFAYATRVSLPAASATASYLRQLSDAQIVSLVQRRAGLTTRTYIAQRTSKALPKIGDASAAPELKADAARARVLKMLVRRAELGRPCPSDADLGALCALGTGVIARILAELEAEGEIVIEGKGLRRSVTIVSTGEWTERSL